MSQIIDFFADVPLIFRTGILLGGIVLFWILEGIIPLYSFKYKKGKHAFLNLLFTTTTALVLSERTSLTVATSPKKCGFLAMTTFMASLRTTSCPTPRCRPRPCTRWSCTTTFRQRWPSVCWRSWRKFLIRRLKIS